MKIRRAKWRWVGGALVLHAGLWSALALERETTLLFGGWELAEGWSFWMPYGGGAVIPGEDSVSVTFEAWRDGAETFPRFYFGGPAQDLSSATHLLFDVESESEKDQTFWIALGESAEGVVIHPLVLAAGERRSMALELGPQAGFDASAVTILKVLRERPAFPHALRIYGIRAVNDGLGESQLDSANKRLESLDARAADSSRAALEGARIALAERAPGYLRVVDECLAESERTLAIDALRHQGKKPLIWRSPLGMPLRGDTLPPEGVEGLEAMRAETTLNLYHAVCLNLFSAESPGEVMVSIADATTPGLLALRRAHWVRARDGSETADAFDAPVESVGFELRTGIAEQVVLWIDTRSVDVTPGVHRAKVVVDTEGGSLRIPVEVLVHDVEPPDRLPLAVFNWAVFFHERSVTPELNDAALANLRDYGINTWNIEDINVPLPELDEHGNFARLVREDRFRGVLEFLQGGADENFILWLGFERGAEVRERFLSPEVVANYLRKVHAIMDEYGVGRENRYFKLMDETRQIDLAANMEAMEVFRAADPAIRFFDNSMDLPETAAGRERFFRLVDMWCPSWDHFLKGNEGFATAASADANTGFYRCLMSRNDSGVNIYDYYRLLPWRALRLGAGNLGFWSYNAGHFEDVWDGTTGPASGGVVVYTRDGELLGSRRWELFREGLDDLRLVSMVFGEQVWEADRRSAELIALCDEVLARPQDPSGADRARATLLRMLSGVETVSHGAPPIPSIPLSP